MDYRRAALAATVVGLASCSVSGTKPASVAKAAGGAAVPAAAGIAQPAPTTSSPSTTAPSGAGSAVTTTTGPTSGAAGAVPLEVPRAVPSCPPTLASELTSTGGADQLITVEAAGWEISYADVELWQATDGCWRLVAGPWPARIGANGFSDDHTEGDDTTPTGRYGVGPVMYGNAPNPGVAYPYVDLTCGDWWDEDPTSARYNTFQQVACGETPPFGGGSEPLWEETQIYPSFAVIDYNTDPVIPYRGSAIFFHADNGAATTGCVSVPLADLDRALDWLRPGLDPAFVMGPAQEIDSF